MKPPMNKIARSDRLSINTLIRAQAQEPTDQLARHRLSSFPPTASKTFRRMAPAEAMRLLGVTESYLRQVAADLFGPVENGRRSYTLEDLARLRSEMDARGRVPGKYIPTRRVGEHLQSISVMNFKGGSAKTTTAANLSQYLALHGYRVLAIDLDPQASLTTLFGVAPEADVGPGQSLHGAIRYEAARDIRECIRKSYIPGLDLVPGALELMEFEHETPRALMRGRNAPGALFDRIAKALAPVEDQYDVVIIDCPPQLGYLSISSLIASTALLITVHPQMLDVMSMNQFLTMLSDLLDVVAQARGSNTIHYDWLNYMLTRFEPTDGPQAQMSAFLRTYFGRFVLHNPTLKSTAISDAGLTSQTIYEVDRSQFTRATYDRALESVNAVNAEIVENIRRAWGRP
jgi:chromosome partitioning protein